jgi:hypothetical protein
LLPRALLPHTLLSDFTVPRRRTLVAASLAIVMAWVTPMSALALRPDERGAGSLAAIKPAPKERHHKHHKHQRRERSSHPRGHARLRLARHGSVGFDISFPQCHGRFPKRAAFKIVGVNRGRAFTANRCLGTGHGHSQLRWAGRRAWLYANTGSPGPRLSKRWPVGARFPRKCTSAEPLSVGCAYDYGWIAARHSYRTAVRAYISLGWARRHATHTPVRNRWWLDVESGNSWRWKPRLNVATLRGAVDYLESRHVASVGFYSAKFMWADITGRTRAFAAYPTWVAGASTLRGAKRYCGGAGLTGGGVELSQFPKNGFDGNYAC